MHSEERGFKVGDEVEVVNGRNYLNDGDALIVKHVGKRGKIVRPSKFTKGGWVLDIDDGLFFMPHNLRPVAPKKRRWKCVNNHDATQTLTVGNIYEGRVYADMRGDEYLEFVNDREEPTKGWGLWRFVEITDDSEPKCSACGNKEHAPMEACPAHKPQPNDPQPYDMDAAFVADQMGAFKRMMPALDQDGRPMLKPEPKPDLKMTPADVLTQDQDRTRRYCGY